MENIHKIIESLLCNGCGTCYSICPQSAIKIDKNLKFGIYYASINEDVCINCGLCLKVCHSKSFFSGPLVENQDLFGDYSSIYTGYATDSILRHRASSGGIISAILHYLIKNSMVDGFVLVKPSLNSPLENVSFISQEIEDIFRYSGTRYFPIPVNKILKELEKLNGKYVIIGTPCQINSLRLYEEQKKSIREKIFLRISFFCGGVPNLNSHRYYMQQYGIKEDRVKSIYRGIGWPGNNVFYLDNGEIIKIPKRPKKIFNKVIHALTFFPIFSQKRCLLCYDRFGYGSDISVGDAWLQEYSNDEDGVSLIISRNISSNKILLDMQKSKVINLEKGNTNQLVKSQYIFLDYFFNFPTTCRFLLGKKFAIENFSQKNRKINWLWGIKINLINIGMKLSTIKIFWPFLFLYGILFYYGYHYVCLIEYLMKKL